MKIHPLVAAALSAAIAVACHGRKDGPVQSTSSNGTSTAPGQQALEDRDQALVRLVQAIPEAPKADVYAGTVRAFAGVDFGTVTPYRAVREEHFVLALKPAGDDKAKSMIEAKEGLEAGRRYTILSLADRDGAAKIDVLSDDAEPPAAGKTKVRIVHAAPEAGTVDVYLSGDPAEKSITTSDYGGTPGFHEVDPASVSLRVKPRQQKGKAAALLVEQIPTLEAGKMYTLVVAPGSRPGKPVEVIRIEDTVTTAARVPAGAAGDGVRALNPTGKTNTIERVDETYEIRPDADNAPPPARPRK
jgi:Domain of unknown function (DUF4397)